jgi:hypothetical protein
MKGKSSLLPFCHVANMGVQVSRGRELPISARQEDWEHPLIRAGGKALSHLHHAFIGE